MKNKLKGVIVKFEMLNDNDEVVEVIAEKTFPEAAFTEYFSSWNHKLAKYRCNDKEVSEYVYEQHNKNDAKYNYADWENCPNVRQAFYNIEGSLIYTEDEVDYEMNL